MAASSARVLAPRTSLEFFRFPDHDALFGMAQHTGHIGEVVLAVGIGDGELLDVREQLGQSEDVEAGVDFVNCLLGRAG